MKPLFRPPFVAFVKKQPRPFQLAIEDAVEDICADTGIGELKVGDLLGIRVYKFSFHRKQYLIAYQPPTLAQVQQAGSNAPLLFVDFHQIGTHENFYASLKRYLKARGS